MAVRLTVEAAAKFGIRVADCLSCGAPFAASSTRNLYCSAECGKIGENVKDAASAKSRKTNGPTKPGWSKGKQYVPRKKCELCGALFYAPPSGLKRGQHRFCSNKCRFEDMARNPEKYPQTRGRRGNGGRRPDLNNQYFRSAWEANWARYLNWLIEQGQIKSWAFETETYEFFSVKRGSRFYTTDFIIVENDGRITRHEVKGYMDQKSRTKLNRMKRYYPDVPITVIDKKAYYAVSRQVSGFIKHWESRR